MKPSTKSFLLESKHVKGKFSLFNFLHGYIYLKWPYLYIGTAIKANRFNKIIKPLLTLLEKWLLANAHKKIHKNSEHISPSFADTYHGKVLSMDHAKQLVTIDQEICMENLEKVIPYSMAKDIIIKNPTHIAVIECPCRKSRENPCQPLDVCLIIGEPFASFAVEHHPNRARFITQSEALKIIQAEHKRGHVHHAFFKDAMLERFYAICNCCSCCCGAMHAHRNHIPMLASSGYVAELDYNKCQNCGICIQNCPFDAIFEKSEKVVIDFHKCMGCGICVSNCPNHAISLHLCPEKGDPLDIQQLVNSDIHHTAITP